MAYTAADLASLDAAILALATGQRVVSVTFGDRTTQYESARLPELQRLREVVAADVARTATPARPRIFKVYSDKGL
jgi:hypothetical protein